MMKSSTLMVLVVLALAGAAAVAAHAGAGAVAATSAVSHQLLEAAYSLGGSCSLSAAGQCGVQQHNCLMVLPPDDKSGVCACFAELGNCLHNANCLNGTNEDLHTAYCDTGDSYCCTGHGEFIGCGVRSDFSGEDHCLCEDLYSGEWCNTTSATCSSSSTCNVCKACCKDYSGDTCDACVQSECDHYICSDQVFVCNAPCQGCCKSYLAGASVQEDCNICVEQTCRQSRFPTKA